MREPEPRPRSEIIIFKRRKDGLFWQRMNDEGIEDCWDIFGFLRLGLFVTTISVSDDGADCIKGCMRDRGT